MNDSQPVKINGRKVLWAGILVLIIAYAFGQPYLENWLGMELPSITEQVVREESSQSRQQPGTARDSGPAANPRQSEAQIGSAASPQEVIDAMVASSFLTPTGKKQRLRSPAGLVYSMGPGGEHRVTHVLLHGKDNRHRDVHSVFEGSPGEILALIDEAYGLIQSNSNRVESKNDQELDFRTVHLVDMKRAIGYLGGKVGKRNNHPVQTKMKLILDNGHFVVTAYPDNR